MSESSFSSFPATKYDALAMLYIQQQDLSGLSPEELFDKYEEAYTKIRSHAKPKRVGTSKIGI